ncbi:hypothetical protein CEK28_09740 [Xenophilus sp. AP218F]|nr:hypothetical protein CEK28_09740 [Xenophilus sp. AP218F]
MRSRLSLIALATALALPAAAQAYSSIYFFGDSLSDVGAFGGQSGLPSGARWTTGYGPNWTNVLAGHYGLGSVANNPLNASTSSSGNNYAQGGAVAQPYDAITQYPGAGGTNGSVEHYGPGGALEIQELPTQVAAYLASTGGKANPNAVYSVWIGGNDVIAGLTAALISNDSAQGKALLQDSAKYAAGSVQALTQAGAKTVIVPNLPNMSAAPLALYSTLTALKAKFSLPDALISQAWNEAWKALSQAASNGANQADTLLAAQTAANTVLKNAVGIPDGTVASVYKGDGTATNPGIAPSLQQLSAGYNQLLDFSLTGAGVQNNIVRANVSALFQEILANPAKYGFTNITGAACSGSAIACASASYPQSYVFTDMLHPTPAANQIVGDYIYGLLQAPYFAGSLPQSGLNNARQLGSGLDSRYEAIRAQKRGVGAVSAFVNGGFGNDSVGFGGANSEAKGQLYTLGVDFQATSALSVGFAVSRQLGKTDIAGSGTPGKVDDRTTLLSGFASYNQEKFWVDGDAHVGSGNLDTSRQVNLGPTQITENGSARQTQYGLRVAGGYIIPVGAYQTGPIASLDYAKVKLAGFTENSGDSSSMAFGSQNVSSLVGRVGWQFSADIGKFSPYAKVSFAHEFNQDERNVTTGLATTVGSWTTSLGAPDGNWMEWTAGVTANFSKAVSAYGQLTATSNRGGGNQTGGNIGVVVSF